MSSPKQQPESHSVIVRLSEEDCRFLKAAAGLRGTPTLAAAINSCVSWMIANLDANLWDDVLTWSAPGRGAQHSPSRGNAPKPPAGSIPGDRFQRQMEGDPETLHLLAIEDVYPGNRRSSRRYPIATRLKIRTETDPAVVLAGNTLNISSTGLLLQTSDAIEPEMTVRVSADWPLQSGRGNPLTLWSRGKIVWRHGELAGLRIEHWEFCEGVRQDDLPGCGTPR
jgi:hypothetical protein